MTCRIARVVSSILAIFLTATALAADIPAAAGLVGLWRFDGSDGRTVRDCSPLKNDGVIQFGELRREKAATLLELNGLDSYVSIAEKTPWRLEDALTVAIWVRPADLPNRAVIFGVPNERSSFTTPAFGMSIAEKHVVFGLWLTHGSSKMLLESPQEVPLDQWSFLVGTYDGATATLFVDGLPVAEKPAHGPIDHNGQPLLIGKGLGSNKPLFPGRIGELRLYRRELTAAEIGQLFKETRQGYDLEGPPSKSFNDGTVIVETHGNTPGGERPWIKRPTRLLEKLDGYRPSADAVKLDTFGGRADRPKEKATGFFYVKQLDGRQWLIDPQGCRFYHVAINTVREPKNPQALIGSSDEWARQVTQQLRGLGFNGLGNGASPHMAEARPPLVWVLRKDFMFAFARQKKVTLPASGTQGFIDNCLPVFHPDFEAFCDQFGRDLAATAGDPWLLGIMTDNELQCPVDLLDRCLAWKSANADLRPNRDAAAAWLASRHGSADPAAITPRDRYEFIAFAFERYYRFVTRAVRKYDPHHLYLGSRLNYHQGEFDNPWFWKMLSAYHDVVSVNYYMYWGPDRRQMARWATWCGKPILLTEWYAKAEDVQGLSNARGAGWLVHTQADRAAYYQHFALAALETPNIVGWHWFKYLDDPPESTALDCAGGANKGMFDAAGRPYQVLADRAKAVNREVYPLIEFFDQRGR